MTTNAKLFSPLHVFTAAAALLAVAGNGTAQITNGSFESGLTGWTVTVPATVGTGSNQSRTSGPNAALWNGGNQVGTSSIAQPFGTTSGQRYMLQFDYGVFSQNQTQNMNAAVAGTGTLVNQTVSGTGPGGTNDTTWSRYYFPFVADSGSTSLTFTDMTTVGQSAGADGNLDNVSVTAVAAGAVSPGGVGTVGTVNFFSGNRALASNGGVATQTNTRVGSGCNAPGCAIDGNTNGNFGANSTTHTNTASSGNQWQVTLPAEYAIDNITVFNRSDCCQDRLVDFDVDFLNSATSVDVLNSFDLGNPNQANTNNDGVSDNGANAAQAFPQYGLRVNLPTNTIGTNVRISPNVNTTISLAEVQANGLANYLQPEGDILNIDIVGVGTHDFVDVAGNAVLDGTLSVDFLGGFTLSSNGGEIFDVLTATTIDTSGLTLDAFRLSFSVVSGGNGQILRLTAIPIPEPSSFAIALFATLGFAGLFRRRRGFR